MLNTRIAQRRGIIFMYSFLFSVCRKAILVWWNIRLSEKRKAGKRINCLILILSFVRVFCYMHTLLWGARNPKCWIRSYIGVWHCSNQNDIIDASFLFCFSLAPTLFFWKLNTYNGCSSPPPRASSRLRSSGLDLEKIEAKQIEKVIKTRNLLPCTSSQDSKLIMNYGQMCLIFNIEYQKPMTFN